MPDAMSAALRLGPGRPRGRDKALGHGYYRKSRITAAHLFLIWTRMGKARCTTKAEPSEVTR